MLLREEKGARRYLQTAQDDHLLMRGRIDARFIGRSWTVGKLREYNNFFVFGARICVRHLPRRGESTLERGNALRSELGIYAGTIGVGPQ